MKTNTNDETLYKLSEAQPSKRVSKIPMSEAQPQLGELANRARYGKEQFILTKRGKAFVRLTPLKNNED